MELVGGVKLVVPLRIQWAFETCFVVRLLFELLKVGGICPRTFIDVYVYMRISSMDGGVEPSVLNPILRDV